MIEVSRKENVCTKNYKGGIDKFAYVSLLLKAHLVGKSSGVLEFGKKKV